MRRCNFADRVTLALGTLLATSLLCQTAGAQSIPTSLGNGADAMLARDDSGNGGPFSGDNMLGGGGNMQIRSGDSTNRNRLGIIRFDTSSVASVNPAGAQLMFHETGNNGRNVTVYGLNDGDAGENWDEATITYNTAPAISFNDSNLASLTTDFDPLRVTNLGTFLTTGSTDETLSFSSAALETFIGNDTNNLLTFFLFQNENGNIVVTTKEGGNAPTLLLVPEPGTALLLSMAGLALAAIRRKKRLN